MNLPQLIRVVSLLSIDEKATLVDFIRNQATDDLHLALEQIVYKLMELGVLLESDLPRSTQEQVATLQALTEAL